MILAVHMVLVVLTVSCVLGLPQRMERSESDLDNPHISTSESPALPEEFTVQLSDVKRQAENLLSKAGNLKSYIVNVSNWNARQVNYLNDESFIDVMIATEEERSAALAEPTEALLKHRKLLFELAIYTKTSRTTGATNAISGENSLRTKLQDIENDLCRVICSADIALVKQNIAVVVNLPELSSAFFNTPEITSTEERFRAYILMNDAEKLMNYTSSIYTHILDSFH